MTDVSQTGGSDTMQDQGAGGTTADKFKGQFASFKSQATDKARDYAGQGVHRATGALDEAARFLEETARTVEEKLGPQYGRYGFSAAESVSGFAEQLRGKEIDELVEDVRALVRKSPAVAIGAAVGLGFVLARLAKAGAGYESSNASALGGGLGGAGGQAAGRDAGSTGSMGVSPSGSTASESALIGTSASGTPDLGVAAGGSGGLGGTTNAANDGSPITPTFPA